MESYSRIRSVKLKRPTPDHPFGFSVRGGHEHGTGIFVSFVDPRSLAYRQGLKVGDQILRVNGFPVSAAVHHECLSLMRIRTSLHLKVRSVGMLPVKEKSGDPLTWKLVEEQPLASSPVELTENHHIGHHHHHHHGTNNNRHQTVTSRMSDTPSQPDSRTEFHGIETKVFIDISGQSGLGCCICKGPPERPGIFVQSTKSNGVAREAGLRPGDQVISCNGHSFLHIPFAEAVYYLKSSKHLNLRVLKGAASDLFPGESSGYNSSASSLNGDAHVSSNAPSESSLAAPSPPGPVDVLLHDHEQANKRLSMVTEENHATDDTDRRSPSRKTLALDRNMEWDEVEQVWRKAEKETIVIEVKGEDPTEKIRSEEERLQEERRKLEETQRRLLEEALRLEEEKRKFEEEKRRSLKKSPSTVSAISAVSAVSNSSSSTESANSLAGALTQEILKRNERRESNPPAKEDERPKPGTVEQKRSLFSNQIDQEARQQHDQLIEEFKRAHRKMFAHTMAEEASKETNNNGEGKDASGEPGMRAGRVQKEIDHERQMVAQRVAGIVRQRQLRIERQHQECAETEREVSKHVTRAKSPPPPPPGVDAHDASRQISRTTPSPSSPLPATSTPRYRTSSKVQPPPPAPPGDYGSSAVAKTHSQQQQVHPPPPMPNPKIPKPPAIPSAATLPAKPVIIEERNIKNNNSGSSNEGQSQTLTPRSNNNKGQAPPPPPPQRLEVVTTNGINPPNSSTHKTQTESSSVPAPTHQNKRDEHPRRPESPSPDYSNSPSPTPSPPRAHRPRHVGVDMQSLESFRLKDPPRSSRKPPPVYFCDSTQQIIQANGPVRLSAYPTTYGRPDTLHNLEGKPVGKRVEPPTVPNGNNRKSDIILQRELEDALARCNMNSNNDISNNGQGKVTIVLGESHTGHNNRPNGHKPNGGGILKMSNGHGTSSTPKTISFGGKY